MFEHRYTALAKNGVSGKYIYFFSAWIKTYTVKISLHFDWKMCIIQSYVDISDNLNVKCDVNGYDFFENALI